MGLHTDLDIHVAATKLLSAVTESVLHMRRDAKKTIGDKLIDHALDITTLIQEANMCGSSLRPTRTTRCP